MKQKHKHEWEKGELPNRDKFIKCKTCNKVSFPNRMPRYKVIGNKIVYNTKGAFGKNNGKISSL